MIPRSIDRGPIEACWKMTGHGHGRRFRDQLIAAPLKLLVLIPTGLVDARFRDQLIAAPLKLFPFSRKLRITLPIPRSIDRGPIEAMMLGQGIVTTSSDSAIN